MVRESSAGKWQKIFFFKICKKALLDLNWDYYVLSLGDIISHLHWRQSKDIMPASVLSHLLIYVQWNILALTRVVLLFH